jgi:tRNA(fMet)-specific endonuclease VapC
MLALDANTILYAFRGKGGVAQKLAAEPPSRIAIPSIVLFEVEAGVLKSQNPAQRRKQLTRLVDACRVLPFDDECAAAAARIQVDLERQGKKIGPMDKLIAATALANGATLVTRNTREYSRVAGLRLENWFEG